MAEDSKQKYKILIVDDERINITTLTQILRPLYTVYIAKDGHTALELAHANRPDVILLDIVMPGMSGFEVLAELKSSEETSQVPVIFITGRDNDKDEEMALSMGAVDYISKPFSDSVVLARVNTHIRIMEYIRTIERLSMIDSLTNLHNRRFFDYQFNREWSYALRENKPLALLIIDIDRFKVYNDRFGHKKGDQLLQSLAQVLTKSVKRTVDIVSRWGGEEFTVMLPDTDLAGATSVAEEIRLNVIHMLEQEVTVSIGVNALIPNAEISADDFFTDTDRALYAAKDAGRNRVFTVNDINK